MTLHPMGEGFFHNTVAACLVHALAHSLDCTVVDRGHAHSNGISKIDLVFHPLNQHTDEVSLQELKLKDKVETDGKETVAPDSYENQTIDLRSSSSAMSPSILTSFSEGVAHDDCYKFVDAMDSIIPNGVSTDTLPSKGDLEAMVEKIDVLTQSKHAIIEETVIESLVSQAKSIIEPTLVGIRDNPDIACNEELATTISTMAYQHLVSTFRNTQVNSDIVTSSSFESQLADRIGKFVCDEFKKVNKMREHVSSI